MDLLYIILIIILVLVKLMIWTCICCVRYRRRQVVAGHERHLITIQGSVHVFNDRDMIVSNDHLLNHVHDLENPVMHSSARSSYEVRDTMNTDKPPSYEQVIHSNSRYNWKCSSLHVIAWKWAFSIYLMITLYIYIFLLCSFGSLIYVLFLI